jgi:hypothetical protein
MKNTRNDMLATWEEVKIHTGIISGFIMAAGKPATSLVTKLLIYRYALHNDVLGNDGPPI